MPFSFVVFVVSFLFERRPLRPIRPIRPIRLIRFRFISWFAQQVPTHWSTYYATEELLVGTWMSDLIKRLSQLQQISTTMHDQGLGSVWLGGLFYPGAFVAATRQQTAQRLQVSLEDLSLKVAVGEETGGTKGTKGTEGYVMTGLILEGGAVVVNGSLQKSRVIRQELPTTLFSWVENKGNGDETSTNIVQVPLYLNSTRDKLVLTIVLHIDGGVEPSEFSRRGTAVCCWAGE